jgi:hypothetical protein
MVCHRTAGAELEKGKQANTQQAKAATSEPSERSEPHNEGIQHNDSAVLLAEEDFFGVQFLLCSGSVRAEREAVGLGGRVGGEEGHSPELPQELVAGRQKAATVPIIRSLNQQEWWDGLLAGAGARVLSSAGRISSEAARVMRGSLGVSTNPCISSVKSWGAIEHRGESDEELSLQPSHKEAMSDLLRPESLEATPTPAGPILEGAGEQRGLEPGAGSNALRPINLRFSERRSSSKEREGACEDVRSVVAICSSSETREAPPAPRAAGQELEGEREQRGLPANVDLGEGLQVAQDELEMRSPP